MTPAPSTVTYIANIRLPTEKAHGLQIVRMCEAFEAVGATTTLLHPARHQPAGIDADPFTYYGVRHPFRLRTLGNVDIVRAERLLRFGLYTVVHFAHAVIWGAYAVRAARRQAPAALYMTRDITTAAALARARMPFVLEVHKAPERWSLRLLRGVVRSPHLRALVVLTVALRDALAARDVDVSRARVLHDGVDLDRFAAPGVPHPAPADRVALYAGQLFPEKGIGVLIEAARLSPDVRVRIVGGMPQHVARWRAVAAGLPNVTIEGHAAPDAIPALQMSAAVLVLPNSGRHAHSSLYTSPMKLFEYMAAGRPIVASDVPAIREVLRHDVNAWLVTPDDPAALAAGIEAVLSDADRAARLASQAREDVRNYTWTGRARAILAAA